MQTILLFVLTNFSVMFLIVSNWMHIYFFIANLVEKAYIRPSFMGNGYAKTSLEKLNETLN